MGDNLGEIFVEVLADTDRLGDSFAEGLGDIEQQAGSVGDRLESALTGPVAKGMAGLGAAAAAGLGAGLTAAAGLDNQLREVVTLFGETGAEAQASLERLSGPLRDLSDQVGIAQSELTDGLYNAISAGVPEENVFEFLETASQFAIGGVTDVETAVDGLTTAINAFGLDAADADQVADAFFAAVQAGKTNAEELSASLFNVAPAASAAGISLEETLASVAGLTASGVPTSVATTQIRAAINELADEGREVAQVFEGITGQTFRDFTAGGGTLEEALGHLSGAAADAGMQVGDYFGSVEASAAATTLAVDASGAFADALDYQADSAGAAADAYELVAESAASQFQRLKTQGMNVLMELGALFLPVVNDMLGAVIGLFDAFRGLPESMTRFIAWGGAALAVLGPMPLLIGKALPTIRMFAGVLLGPVGALAAVGAGLVALYRNFEPFREAVGIAVVWVRHLWGVFREGDGVLDGIAGMWDSVALKFGDGEMVGALSRVTDGASHLWDVFREGDGVADGVVGVVETLAMSLDGTAVGDWLRDLGDAASSTLGAFQNWQAANPAAGIVDTIRTAVRMAGAEGGIFDTLIDGARAGFDALVGWLSSGGVEMLLGWFVEGRLRLLEAAMELFPVILDAAVTFLPGLVDFIAGTVVPAIVDVIVGAVPVLLGAAVDLFSSLVSAATDILPGIVDVLFGTVLPTIVDTVVGMVGPLLGAALELFGALVDAVVEVVPPLVSTLLGDVLPSILDALMRMLPTLLSAAVDLFGALIDAAVTVVPPLVSTLLGDVLPTLIRAVLDMVPDLLVAAVELFGTLVQGVLDVLPDLITILLTEVLPTLVTTIVGLVPDLLGAAVTAFGALVSAIWDILPTLVSTIVMDVVPALAGAVVGGVGALFSAGLELMGGLIDAVGEKLGEARDAVSGVVASMRDAAVDRATELRDRVGDRLSELRDRATERTASMRDGVVERVGAMRDQASAAASAMRDRVVGWIDDLRGSSLGFVVEWVEGTIARARELRDRAVETVKALRDRVVGWIDDLRSDTLGTIHQWTIDAVLFVLDLRTRFQNAIQRMVDRVRDRIDELLAWFRDLPGNILTAIGDLGSLLVQAGKDLVGGLVSGVGDMASSAATAVGDVASGMMSRARGVFRLGSPSREMADVGHDVIAGLAVGVEGEAPSAVGAMGTAALGVVDIARAVLSGEAGAEVGHDVVAGLAGGVEAEGPTALGAIAGVASGLMDRTRSILGISSPSVVFHGYGTSMMDGLAEGIRTGSSSVLAALGGVLDSVVAAASRATGGALSGAGREFVDEMKRLSIFRGRDADIAAVARQMSDQQLRNELARLQSGQGLTDRTSSAIVARRAQQQLGSLFGRNQHGRYIDLNALGDDWRPLRDALLAAGWRGRAGDQMEALYQPAGRDIIGGIISGINAGQPGLLARIDGMTAAMLDGFRRALGIRSPSTVFAGFGRDIADGVSVGVRSHASEAVAAIERFANDAKSAGQLGARFIETSAGTIDLAAGPTPAQAAGVGPGPFGARAGATINVRQHIVAPSPTRAGSDAARKLQDAVYLAGGQVDGQVLGTEGRPW